MANTFEKQIDTVDAAIFTGDALEYKANRDFLADHLQRWRRELARASSAALEVDVVCTKCHHVSKARFTHCIYCGEKLPERLPCRCHPVLGKNAYLTCPRHGKKERDK